MTKKLLILSVSAGAGHMRAAEAVKQTAEHMRPNIEATHVDAMTLVTTAFRKIYADGYIRLVDKSPEIWRFVYNQTNEASPNGLVEKTRRQLERLNARPLLAMMRKAEPDAILCTHFMPAEMLARQIKLGNITCPVWVQITDFDLHRMWIHEGMAGYFVANEEMAYRLRAQGIAAHTIHSTGIPIMPAFSHNLCREELAAELGLNPNKTTLLLMNGGAGIGNLDALAERILKVDSSFQLIALAGKNEETLRRLKALAVFYPKRLFPQGFTNQVERLMACADLVITKPGGLTVSECLAMSRPMIVTSPIPGQEEHNADYLLEHGAAFKANDNITLEYRIRFLLKHPDKLADMRMQAQSLGHPRAAERVIELMGL